jgi:hypothetical protein
VSSHSLSSKRRYPDPKRFERKLFKVGHMTFETISHPTDGQTFALIPHMAHEAKNKRPLFSGHINKGMANELRLLALEIAEMELLLKEG